MTKEQTAADDVTESILVVIVAALILIIVMMTLICICKRRRANKPLVVGIPMEGKAADIDGDIISIDDLAKP